MLNRTNRTLSAHLNRLNLGTRSLASQASFINGDSTLHTRHVYPVAMRAGMVGVSRRSHDYWDRSGFRRFRAHRPYRRGSSRVARYTRGSIRATDRPSPADWQVNLLDQAGLRRAEPGPCLDTPLARAWPADRKPFMGKRRQQRAGLAGACQQATLGPVAATVRGCGRLSAELPAHHRQELDPRRDARESTPVGSRPAS